MSYAVDVLLGSVSAHTPTTMLDLGLLRGKESCTTKTCCVQVVAWKTAQPRRPPASVAMAVPP